jgi:cell division inhibitor SepF
MKNKVRQVMSFLGLVEDEYNDFAPTTPARPTYDEAPEVGEGRAFPTSGARVIAQAPRPSAPIAARQGSPISVLDSATSGAPRVRPAATVSAVRPGISSFSAERDVVVFVPTKFDDASKITEALRQNRCVILQLTGVDQVLHRRVVDYASGTVFALNGKIERLRPSVFLVTPQHLRIDAEAKERLRHAH